MNTINNCGGGGGGGGENDDDDGSVGVVCDDYVWSGRLLVC